MSNASARLGTNTSPVVQKAEEPDKAPVVSVPKRIKIILDENENIPPSGQFFGINGASYLLRPGEEASVPPGIVDILENAIISVPILDSGRRTSGWRNRHRFPYQIVHARERAERE